MVSSSKPESPKNIAVVLEISSDGFSFAEGFPVKLQIVKDGQIIREEDDLQRIPPAPEMPQLYQNWQTISGENSRQLQAVPAQITNVANLEDWRRTAEDLERYCSRWFQHWAFRNLRDRIVAKTKALSNTFVSIIPIIIRIKCQTENDQQNEILRRIPWHTWDLFNELRNGEFALFTGFREPVPTLEAPVKVLAIFGSSQGGLQLEEDRRALKLLEERGAEITWKTQPTEEELSHLLFDHHWQILFFAGHSSSQVTSGLIQIRDNRFLRVKDLRNGLTNAVSNGLKLAIFNSCDGLGIADFLTELEIPSVIVMREPVPDQIARKFLVYFLQEFSQGKPLCLALRQARDRLEVLQLNFPAATWLPVAVLNPNQPEFIWPNYTQPEPGIDTDKDSVIEETIVDTPPTPPRNGLLLLLLRWRSISFRLRIMLGLVALVGIVSIPTLIKASQCQLFPTNCTTSDPTSTNPSPKSVVNINNFISSGEKMLIDNSVNRVVKLSDKDFSLKQQGITAFSEYQYLEAMNIFRRLPSQITKDPESLIYRNNAIVNLRHAQNPTLPIYTIAVAAPLNDNAGLDILFGVAQAQDVAVNQGFNLQVVIANDNNNLIQAQKIAEALAKDADILAVVGHYTSPNTCAALKIYSPKNLVVISPTSTVVNLRSYLNCPDPNKVFFRTVSSSRVEAESLVRYLVEDLKKPEPKVVVFYNSNEGFSKDLFQQFEQVIRAFHGRIIAPPFDLSDPKFDVSKLPPAVNDADALVVLPDGGTNNSMALDKSIKIIKLNQGSKPVLAANSMYLQRVINDYKEMEKATVNNLFLAVDWHPKQCGAEKFRKETNKYWGGDLNRRTALAYEAVQAILQAIKLADKPVKREGIRQKLSDTDIRSDTAASSAVVEGSLIRFDTSGDRIGATTRAIVTVNSINNRLSFELVPKYASCPAK
jgi:branched-chain amino acid transport system substrate-binding protein